MRHARSKLRIANCELRVANGECRIGIIVILILYLLLALTYSVVTPFFEVSDELWHYPMVKYIADHWALPVQNPEATAAVVLRPGRTADFLG
jgi:hypothetical protein